MKKLNIKIMCAVLAAFTASSLFAGCSSKINGSETALVINDEEIPLGEADFYLRYMQSEYYYYSLYYSYYLSGSYSSEVWDAAYDNSSDESSDESSSSDSSSEEESVSYDTYGDYYKDYIKESLVRLVVTRQKAIDQYGISLSDEEQDAITQAAQKFMEDNPEAGENFGVTAEMVGDILEMYTYQTNAKPYATEDVDRDVSDEEAAQSTMMYVRVSKNDEDEEEEAQAYAAGTLEVSEDEEEEELKTNAEKYEEAEEVLALIKEAGDIDTSEANDIADSVDESFFAAEYSYGADDDSLDSAIYEALDTLSDEEVYGSIVETDDFYWILKMEYVFDEEATENMKASIISERETEAYSEAQDEWYSQAEVKEKSCWKKIDLNDSEIYTVKFTEEETSDTSETSESSGTSETSETSETSATSESDAGQSSESSGSEG